jgi:predicted Zn-dependent protease
MDRLPLAGGLFLCYHTGMTEGTIEALQEQLKRAPSPRLYAQLADELKAADRVEESIAVLREGAAKFPRYLSARVALGRALFGTGAFGECVEVMKAVLAEDPENVVAIRTLAQAYEAQGERVEAIKKYKLLRIFVPDDEDLQARIAALDLELNPPANPRERRLRRLRDLLGKMEHARTL